VIADKHLRVKYRVLLDFLINIEIDGGLGRQASVIVCKVESNLPILRPLRCKSE